MPEKNKGVTYEIDMHDLLKQEGYNSQEEMLSVYFNEGSVPAMCSDGCYVEPDGHCEHGCESFMLFMGVI